MMDMSFVVGESENNLRIEKAIVKFAQTNNFILNFRDVSIFLRKGLLYHNEKKVKRSMIVQEGDRILVKYFHHRHVATEKKQINEEIAEAFLIKVRKNIIYDTKDFLVLNKEAGWAVQGGSNIKVSIDDILPLLDDKCTMKLVHRIDMRTSGALLIAKNGNYAKVLSEMFAQHEIRKIYIGIVVMNDLSISIRDNSVTHDVIKYYEKDRLKQRDAITKHKVLCRSPEANIMLMQFEIETGRKHQVRIHAMNAGMPILGDEKYGRRKKILAQGHIHDEMFLHSYRVQFEYKNDKVDVIAPLPTHFIEMCNEYFPSISIKNRMFEN
ncbi:Ribosomal large subunit pseudouridine synthase C [Candidatus Fokinia solitaria]|uniref:Ribosomal large subunit pseudouridine synthase C n=1 Tax=Candidatus Fokinia solitaria TaxID=1802984 RepID=A0A2U8BR81_9RICK|nr:RluA family pseudouridine synthase [Candidatus Fokinia solitaria]AWD32844.1 Ribosomal large subunit pseudouridine synthase C [Candidatus Fokinia solitaria]